MIIDENNLDIDKENPKYFFLLGSHFFRLDKYEEALEYFCNYLEIEKEDKDTYKYISDCLNNLGDFELSNEYYKAYLTFD